MMHFKEYVKNPQRISQVVILAVIIASITACATTSKTPMSSSASPEFMFVQIADDLIVNPASKTIRLVNINQQTLYFSDRPQRIAGHIDMAAYLEEWTAKAGKDNFSGDPPNAVLSVYEPGKPENTLAVVEIFRPRIDGNDLVYGYKVIEGNLPTGGGATALFIDWIGPGGGVGRGFHGVGVGFRGPGWR